MKKRNIFIPIFAIIILLFNSSVVFCSSVEAPSISSEAAILIDTKTNKILYKKNESKQLYPASITKIMTAILVLENSRLTDKVTASYNAIMTIPDGYSIANIQIGEELNVEQLLQLLLLHSANDAANVLAEYVGGSLESFVSMMNTKADELNLTNTNFTNAYGLHDDKHYSTASDLAILMKYCMKDENFRKIAGMASCAIPVTNKFTTRKYTSTNGLIVPNSEYYYSYATAGKTGFTSQAKECLVSTAYKDNLELICVILGSENSSIRFNETKILFEYGFKNYSVQTILDKGNVATNITVDNGSKDTRSLDLILSDNISALLSNSTATSDLQPKIELNSYISAPIKEGEVLGQISYEIDGNLYRSSLLASHAVEESQFFEFVFYAGIVLLICIFLIALLSKNKKS